MNHHVVVVEDDRSVREMLVEVLRSEGLRVDAFGNGEDVIVEPSVADCDLLILDVGLPGVGGFDVCRHIRRRGRTAPILMLTARAEIEDRVNGLDAGADDYLVKPFALDELLARVRALLRRRDYLRADDGGTGNLQVGDVVLDVPTRTVTADGTPIALTRLEFDLLRLLMARAPSVVDRATIHDEIWQADPEHLSNALEVCVSQIRRKLESPGRPRLLHTVRGIGYVMRAEADAPTSTRAPSIAG